MSAFNFCQPVPIGAGQVTARLSFRRNIITDAGVRSSIIILRQAQPKAGSRGTFGASSHIARRKSALSSDVAGVRLFRIPGCLELAMKDVP